jgi:hypothetical protein
MFPLHGGVDLGLTKVHHIPPLPKPVDSQPPELLPCALRIFCLPGYLGFQRGTTNITRRAQRAAVDKQRTFSPEDVGPALSGKADIGEQVSLWTQLQLLLLFATLASRLNSHFAHLAPLCLIVKGRWRALWRDTTTDHYTVLLGSGTIFLCESAATFVGAVNPTRLRIVRELIWDIQTIQRRLQRRVICLGRNSGLADAVRLGSTGGPSTEERGWTWGICSSSSITILRNGCD